MTMPLIIALQQAIPKPFGLEAATRTVTYLAGGFTAG